MDCPYCGKNAPLVWGDKVYPHRPDLHDKRFYLCEPCNAYVGCHKDTNKAFGTLANAELRKARSAAHAEFDPLWQMGYMKRTDAYSWLASELGIPVKQAHIGMMDMDLAVMTYTVSKAKFQQFQME